MKPALLADVNINRLASEELMKQVVRVRGLPAELLRAKIRQVQSMMEAYRRYACSGVEYVHVPAFIALLLEQCRSRPRPYKRPSLGL